ncbi:malate dehydrogenase [Candidatus Bathyarchaeota archaeon]|nr:malate dehydrogenase [Candidatus Bathyarchaeota archaeon]
MVHIAIVGNGRIGRPTAYTLLNERLADEISLVDIKPKLSWAFGEELKHAAASLKYDVKINTYEDDTGVHDADLIVVCPGRPRLPGEQISRRDLVKENAEIIRQIAEYMVNNNPGARWVIVTNPVDAMATLFKKLTGIDYVIGTGDHPDTMRFKTKLSADLGIPVSSVDGYVGGEHGSAAYVLWSTVKVEGKPLSKYLEASGKSIDKKAIEAYVRSISKQILDVVGATEYGPAAAFRDIIRSIIQDRRETYSVAVSTKIDGLNEPVNVNIPIRVGKNLGPSIWNKLTEDDKKSITEAAKAIYENYRIGLDSIQKA